MSMCSAPPYYSQHTVFASPPSTFFHFKCIKSTTRFKHLVKNYKPQFQHFYEKAITVTVISLMVLPGQALWLDDSVSCFLDSTVFTYRPLVNETRCTVVTGTPNAGSASFSHHSQLLTPSKLCFQ